MLLHPLSNRESYSALFVLFRCLLILISLLVCYPVPLVRGLAPIVPIAQGQQDESGSYVSYYSGYRIRPSGTDRVDAGQRSC